MTYATCSPHLESGIPKTAAFGTAGCWYSAVEDIEIAARGAVAYIAGSKHSVAKREPGLFRIAPVATATGRESVLRVLVILETGEKPRLAQAVTQDEPDVGQDLFRSTH